MEGIVFVAGAAFALGVVLPAGSVAVALTAPWLLVTAGLALKVLRDRIRMRYSSPAEFGFDQRAALGRKRRDIVSECGTKRRHDGIEQH